MFTISLDMYKHDKQVVLTSDGERLILNKKYIRFHINNKLYRHGMKSWRFKRYTDHGDISAVSKLLGVLVIMGMEVEVC